MIADRPEDQIFWQNLYRLDVKRFDAGSRSWAGVALAQPAPLAKAAIPHINTF